VTIRVDRMSSRGGDGSPPMRANSSSAAAAPMAAGSWVTTLTGGLSLSASAKSSNPIRAAALLCPLSIAPMLVRSLLVNSAVGGSGSSMRPVTAAAASARLRRPCRTRRSRFGRYTYAIGSNAEAARRAGIAVDRHLIKVYALSGWMAGIAGLLSLANFGSTTIAGHTTDNLTVITAVVLGGASLFGGRGSMLGTVIGLFIPEVLLTGLVILTINQYWQDVAIGVVLAAAVYLDQFRRRLRERA